MSHAFTLGRCELGVATAATQIEGGLVDTNWQHWADEPGHIADGSTPQRAADHWNRVDQDIALLVELGVKHYRMGLEWARIEPACGVFDDDAMAHYVDELTKLGEAGITPLVTLHHFNNPWWFEQAGGFLGKDSLAHFRQYVDYVVQCLHPYVRDWITINEPNVYATNSYQVGTWPPGHQSLPETVRVMQRLAVAHIEAYRLIHSIRDDSRVGVANHLRVFQPANRLNPANRAAAWLASYLFQDALQRAMSFGQFMPPLHQPISVPIRRYYDFQGINYYSRSTVTGLQDGVAKDVPVNDLGWEIYPAGLAEVIQRVNRSYPGPIFITENGTADAKDAFRPLFIYDHLKAAVESGAPVRRYYHWCFTDNWEWAEGEGPRFGLVALDYETQERQPRESAWFYADIAANGGVTNQAFDRWVAGCRYPQ